MGTDPARIEVGVAAEAGVASITAYVVSETTQQEVTSVSDFTFAGGDPTNGYWQSATELLLPALGSYQIDVEVTDNDGVHTDQVDVGQLSYFVTLYFTNIHSTKTVTYDNRDLVVTGKLMGRWPGSGAVHPVGGMPIEFNAADDGDYTAPTAANGQFSFSSVVTDDTDFSFVQSLSWETAEPYYIDTAQDLDTPTITPRATRITEHIDHRTIHSDQTVTVSGVATWKTPDGWQPMPNAQVYVGFCNPGYPCLGGPTSVTTDASGGYSATLFPPYNFRVIGVSTGQNDLYLTASSASLTETIKQVTAINNVYAVRDTDTGNVYVEGYLDVGGGSLPSASVTVQFSTTGTGGWKTVGTVAVDGGAGRFQQEFVQSKSGYWRISFAGQPLFLPTTTDPVFVS